jgi:hypothetical protein
MASVETPYKRRRTEQRPGVAGDTKPRRRAQGGSVRSSGTTTRARAANAEAARAKANFDALSGYFRDRSQLRRALGWASPTMRVWEDEGPARPRSQYSERVRLLLVIARAADEWVHDDVHRVGAWMISANDAIDGLTPATIVRELGDDGVERLLSGMHLIAPRTRAHESVDLSPQELARALDRLGLIAPRPVPPVEIDLSDFDDQNARSA